MASEASMQLSLQTAYRYLESVNIEFAAPLTPQEFDEIERAYRFAFPADLRYFLSLGLPTGSCFTNWRSPNSIEWGQEHILSGIAFDIRESRYWRTEWGPRPPAMEEAVGQALETVRRLPRMLPIFSHCFLPSAPTSAGNPIFAVYQTDVIHRGSCLADFLLSLLRGDDYDIDEDKNYPCYSATYRHISFWTDLARENHEDLFPRA